MVSECWAKKWPLRPLELMKRPQCSTIAGTLIVDLTSAIACLDLTQSINLTRRPCFPCQG